MSAEAEIKALYARWERIEAERRDRSDDLKELFAEAKGQGFNAKALRTAFNGQYADENMPEGKRQKRDADDADVDLYRAALGGGSHARVREASPTRPDARRGDESDVTDRPQELARDEPEAAAEVAGECLREPVAAEQGQTIREGDAPRETRSGEARKSAHPDTEFPIHERPSNRDASTDGKAWAPGASQGNPVQPQAKAEVEAFVSELPEPATHDGHREGEAASAGLPIYSNPQPKTSPAAGIAETDSPLPSASAPFDNPRCQSPHSCSYAHSKEACWDCLMAWAKRPVDEQKRLWAEATQGEMA